MASSSNGNAVVDPTNPASYPTTTPTTRSSATSRPILPSNPSASTSSHFILGTRKSALALTQTEMVSADLASHHPTKTFVVEWMTTLGDRNQSTPLHLLTPYSQQQPAKSLWTDELEARLVSGAFDLLVHSLKDVPTSLKEGCEIGAMLEREDPRDALVVKEGLQGRVQRLEDLKDGDVVGTGSVRRVAQLKRKFPHLKFEDMRGNLNTRFAKLDSPSSPYSCLILAQSGLNRLSLSHRATSPLSSPTLYHAIGQGALGVEIRTHDPRVREALRGLGHWQTEWVCAAERACLRVLEGGCSVPVGAESHLEELDHSYEPQPGEEEWIQGEKFPEIKSDSPMLWFSGIVDLSHPLPLPGLPMPPLKPRLARLTLRTCVTSLDGSKQVVHSPPPVLVRSYQQAERWGELCARHIKELGGAEILDEVGRLRRERERADLERAIERSRKAAEEKERTGADEAEETEGEGRHQGLEALVRVLTKEGLKSPASAS